MHPVRAHEKMADLETKIVTKTCSKCGIKGRAEYEFYAKGSVCKECVRKKQRAYIANLKQSGTYEAYLDKHRGEKKEAKARARRARGCLLRKEITKRAAEKAAEKKANENEFDRLRREFIADFCGPPRPGRKLLGDACYSRRRYQTKDHVREYQIAKRHKCVTDVTFAYARCLLGISKAPKELIEAKQVYLRIRRELKNE